MDLHTVESSLHGSFSSSGEFLDRVLDLFDGHGLWRCCAIFRAIQCLAGDGNIARTDTVLAIEQ